MALLGPDDLVSIEAEIDDDVTIERLDLKLLPRNLNQLGDESLRAYGDPGVRDGNCVALYVPSAAIHGEWNALLNPEHPGFPKLKSQKPRFFEFDLGCFAEFQRAGERVR